MTKQHKAHKQRTSLKTHGRKCRRASKGHRFHGGDSGFGGTLAGLTAIGHARGY